MRIEVGCRLSVLDAQLEAQKVAVNSHTLGCISNILDVRLSRILEELNLFLSIHWINLKHV
jgi:hypothetical protein